MPNADQRLERLRGWRMREPSTIEAVLRRQVAEAQGRQDATQSLECALEAIPEHIRRCVDHVMSEGPTVTLVVANAAQRYLVEAWLRAEGDGMLRRAMTGRVTRILCRVAGQRGRGGAGRGGSGGG